MRFFLILFLLFTVTVGLVGISLGYLLHWILPISLDTSIIVGFMLGYITFNAVQSFIKPVNKFMEEEGEDEIVISAKDFRSFTQTNLRKPRRK